MGNIRFSFEYPWLLLLLAILPLIWLSSFQSMAGLGPGRRFAALLFRSVVMLVIVFALAGIQWVWISDKLTVIYLLDQSDSIARAKHDVMLEYAIKLAQASFPEDSANRVVIITDGIETAQRNNRQSHRQVVADRTK